MSDHNIGSHDQVLEDLKRDLTNNRLPSARELLRYEPTTLDKLVAEVGSTDWAVESRAVTRQMGVSDEGKAKLLAIARRTHMSPTRALDTAIAALYSTTLTLNIPGPDEIAAQLAAGVLPGVQLPKIHDKNGS